MSDRRRAPVGVLLSVVFAVATAFAVALIVVTVTGEFHTARAAAVTQLERNATAQADGIRVNTSTYIASEFRGVVSQPGIASLVPALCKPDVVGLIRLIPSASAAIVRGDGTVVCSAGDWNQPSNAAWIQKAFQDGFATTAPIFRPGSTKPFLGYAMAVPSKSGRPAVMGVLMPSVGFLLTQAPPHTDLELFDTATGVVMDASPAQKLVGRHVSNAEVAAATQHRPSLTVTENGVRRIVTYVPVVGTTWVVSASMPESRALAVATSDLQRNLLIGGLMVLVVIALGWVMTRQIARPLRRLRRSLGAMTGPDGAHVKLPEEGPRELADLGRALNEMIDARSRSEARLASLVRHSSDLVLIVDRSQTLTYATPSIGSFTGADARAAVGSHFLDLVHPDDRALVHERFLGWQIGDSAPTRMEFRLASQDRVRDVEAQVQNLLDDDAVDGLVITCHDITDRKASEADLAHAATHDALTGLPNRTLVLDRLTQMVARGGRSGLCGAVLFVDIDRFKLVNDSRGHGTGDALLVDVAQRLGGVIRPGDTLGRFGGDEFVVLSESLQDSHGAIQVAERLLEEMTAPFVIEGQEVFVTVSIGIALARPGDEASSLLSDADAALYRAKDEGRAAFALFDDPMREDIRRRLDLGNKLRRALEDDTLSLAFQPVVSLRDEGTCGVEALLRWECDGEPVPPDVFIPVAEETGLIVPIGEWVLDRACSTFQEWSSHPDFPPDLKMSVNVSARQLGSPRFVDMVANTLRTYDVDPSRLVVEVTESVFLSDRAAAAQVLGQLRAIGMSVSIDDFGIGYSSLGYLEQLPADELKIDRSFVARLEGGYRAQPIVRSVVQLAHAVGLDVVAEGIEMASQRDLLAAMGCDRAQGYLFARPLPPDRALQFVMGHAAARVASVLPQQR